MKVDTGTSMNGPIQPDVWVNWTAQETWENTVSSEREKRNIVLPLEATRDTMRLFMSVFKCEHGGECCTGPEGDAGLAVFDEEAKRLAKLKGMSYAAFVGKYAKRIRAQDGLPDAWQIQYPCPFYDSTGHRCSIYKDRPIVCQTFPLGDPQVAPDGTIQLTVDSRCPGGRLAAYRILRYMQAVQRGTPRENAIIAFGERPRSKGATT